MVPQDIKLTVKTSAINSLVDLTVESAASNIGAPFALFAKVLYQPTNF